MPINQPGSEQNNYFANMPKSQREAAKNLKRKEYQFDPTQLEFDKIGPQENTA